MNKLSIRLILPTLGLLFLASCNEKPNSGEFDNEVEKEQKTIKKSVLGDTIYQGLRVGMTPDEVYRILKKNKDIETFRSDDDTGYRINLNYTKEELVALMDFEFRLKHKKGFFVGDPEELVTPKTLFIITLQIVPEFHTNNELVKVKIVPEYSFENSENALFNIYRKKYNLNEFSVLFNESMNFNVNKSYLWGHLIGLSRPCIDTDKKTKYDTREYVRNMMDKFPNTRMDKKFRCKTCNEFIRIYNNGLDGIYDNGGYLRKVTYAYDVENHLIIKYTYGKVENFTAVNYQNIEITYCSSKEMKQFMESIPSLKNEPEMLKREKEKNLKKLRLEEEKRKQKKLDLI